jgi:hypothetical protein
MISLVTFLKDGEMKIISSATIEKVDTSDDLLRLLIQTESIASVGAIDIWQVATDFDLPLSMDR